MDGPMIDERSKQILNAIIQSYIHRPDPVGSRYVTKKYDFGVSPATIRNIMADLEELGFLSQPHTSAGRVPTDRGYRFYVDTLLNQLNQRSFDLDRQAAQNIIRKLEALKNDINVFFAEVSVILSRLSNYMGIAQPPKAESTTFNKLELIRYKEDLIVAVLLTNEGIIKSRVLQADPKLTQSDLNRIAGYLNSEFSGFTIDEIRRTIAESLKSEKVLWDSLIIKAITIYEDILSFSDNELFMEGFFDIMNLPDFSDISKLRDMYRAIKDKHVLLRIIEDLSKTEGIQVIIGNENPIEELSKFSIVATTYGSCGKKLGVIALIGPTRMDYPKAIEMVDLVSRCICETLKNPE